MLITFKFKNFKSFFDETILDMSASYDKSYKDINTFEVNEKLFKKKESHELLKSALIFGANASGKTNVLKAMAYMKSAVLFSGMPNYNYNSNVINFAFYDYAKNEESLYEVDFIKNNSRYLYGFKIEKGVVKEEYLYQNAQRKTEIFKRDNSGITIIGLKPEETKLIKINDKTLFISFAMNFNLASASKSIHDVFSWFNDDLIIVFGDVANYFDIYNIENGKYKNQALSILKQADIGIKDFNVIKDKKANMLNLNEVTSFNNELMNNPSNLRGQIKIENDYLYSIDIDTAFDVYGKDGKVVNKKDVMLLKEGDFNSEGTMRLFFYLGWILLALDKGKTLFIDEFDSKLHCLLADYLLKLFNSIDKNPNNAQVIATLHNVLIMDGDFRRDQIYFTYKDEIGKSTLYSLFDVKGVRKEDLFSKKYLAEFYCKLPEFHK